MREDYTETARRIVSNLGHDRAREVLDFLEQGDILKPARATGATPATPPFDEDQLAASERLTHAVRDAVDQIPWMIDESIDEETRYAMRSRVAEALRIELGSE